MSAILQTQQLLRCGDVDDQKIGHGQTLRLVSGDRGIPGAARTAPCHPHRSRTIAHSIPSSAAPPQSSALCRESRGSSPDRSLVSELRSDRTKRTFRERVDSQEMEGRSGCWTGSHSSRQWGRRSNAELEANPSVRSRRQTLDTPLDGMSRLAGERRGGELERSLGAAAGDIDGDHDRDAETDTERWPDSTARGGVAGAASWHARGSASPWGLLRVLHQSTMLDGEDPIGDADHLATVGGHDQRLAGLAGSADRAAR